MKKSNTTINVQNIKLRSNRLVCSLNFVIFMVQELYLKIFIFIQSFYTKMCIIPISLSLIIISIVAYAFSAIITKFLCGSPSCSTFSTCTGTSE